MEWEYKLVQTFLPYPDFETSAACLDRQRLGKQRVEVLQILKALESGGGWKNHPITKMWKGFVPALAQYGVAICEEWIGRGYNDTCLDKITVYWKSEIVLPPWIGDAEFHLSHKSNLIRKLPNYYGKLWPDVPANLPYIWRV